MNNPRTALPAAFLLDLHHASSPPPDSSVTLPRLRGSMSGFGAFSIKGGRPRAGPKASPLQGAFQDSDEDAEEMPQAAAGAEELQVGVAMMRAGFLQGPSALALREKEWARQGCKGLGCARDAGATSTALAAVPGAGQPGGGGPAVGAGAAAVGRGARGAPSQCSRAARAKSPGAALAGRLRRPPGVATRSGGGWGVPAGVVCKAGRASFSLIRFTASTETKGSFH